MDNGKIGSFIKELRKEKGLTQKDLADALHITDRAVSKWERGLNAPDIALLEPLAERLGVTVGELIRGERAEEDPTDRSGPDETKNLLDYSQEEVKRKVGRVRKKYLGLLAGCLALALLVGGALLWRSGVLFLLDKKVSPDGESVVWVYSRQQTSWPLRFTARRAVQIVESRNPGGSCFLNDCEYEGLWWAPDSRRYLLALEWQGEQYLLLDGHANLKPLLNMGGADTEYQFLQWGKDGVSMLFYYKTERSGNPYNPKEGYFWYNCATGKTGGELELPNTWYWGGEA